MDERLNDYNKYDKLTLCVKDNKTRAIIDHYAHFGWELVESVSNRKYGNIMDLTFIRPHSIKNKDKVQLLQVGLEVELNKIAKQEKRKHSKSVATTLSFLVAGALLVLAGVLNILNATNVGIKILAISLLTLGAILILLPMFITPKIVRKENARHIKFVQEYNSKIEIILNELNALKKE